MSMRSITCALAIAALLAAAAVQADNPPPAPTIKDLKKKKPVEIQQTAPVATDPQRARETYQQFLDLNSGDVSRRNSPTARR